MDPFGYLYSLEKLGIKFGLENIRTICTALGDPQSAWPSVIVAGTNGKGSVSAMVERGLRAAGLKTGLYTSPHLVRLEERFTLDGNPVETALLHEAAEQVRATVQHLRGTLALVTEPTFFEVTTAMAFEVFRRAGVEFVVLEVGLGGRFDATNVASPVAGAVTTIDFDHERFLGNTIAQIAMEKAGVIKPNMRLVVGETKPEAVGVFREACRERGATMVAAAEGAEANVTTRAGLAVLELTTPVRRYEPMTVSLRGRHQAANALVAVRLLEQLADLGFPVDARAIRAAVTTTRWPGRLDLRVDRAGREVLCDAAHNPAGARALGAYLREWHPDPLPIVFGIMKDKDLAGTLEPLLDRASHLIFTRAATDRALPPDLIAGRVSDLRRDDLPPVEVEGDVAMALERAWGHAPLICAAGSIFLIGEVLSRLGDEA